MSGYPGLAQSFPASSSASSSPHHPPPVPLMGSLPSPPSSSLESLLAPLPFADRSRVLSELSSLLSQTASLTPRLAPYQQPGGFSSTCLCLSGTVPIFYKSASYNIPVRIWLTDDFPFRPPHVLVTPTRDMRIKDRHKHVDSAGTVYLPYLHSWGQDSSLVELCIMMSSVFSEDPPVFTVSAAAAGSGAAAAAGAQSDHAAASVHPVHHHPPPPPQQQQQQSPTAGGLQPHRPPALPVPVLSSSGAQSASLSSLMSSSSPQALLPPPSLTPSPEPASPASSARQRLQSALSRKAQELLRAHHKAASADMESILAQQQLVGRRRSVLDQQLAVMAEERLQLQSSLCQLQACRAELSAWLQQHEADDGRQDVDGQVRCGDCWSRQLLETVSDDAALDDALYSLDRALADGRIDFALYVRQTRQLSRRQYFHRQLAAKIQQRQLEQRQTRSAPQQQQPQPPPPPLPAVGAPPRLSGSRR